MQELSFETFIEKRDKFVKDLVGATKEADAEGLSVLEYLKSKGHKAPELNPKFFKKKKG